ncbi:MAG: PRC-barrel domain-containing protein [Candidatus Saccharibacteria bacterium]|nr:PRC-barrel domain-containing protein [Candidatus Saccharibacteria bacterium]
MLLVGSKVSNMPILSLHVGGPIAEIREAIIDPEELQVVAYSLDGPIIKNDPEVGNILDTQDVREISNAGLIVDSADRFTTREDVIRFDKIMNLEFHLVGLKVVTTDGKKLGKIVDYTLDSGTFMIYQLIVQRPFMSSLLDPELTINRSQIVEIDDFKVTIKHDKAQVKMPKKDKKEEAKEFVPNFTNPFRKPAYTEEDSIEDNSSEISE